MSMQHGISGLWAASRSLDVIGNNVANANTVGFKTSQARFASVFAAAGAKSDPGLGVAVTGVASKFTQGGLLSTGNPLDLAISGEGFFILREQGANAYTRNGQMQIDKDGFLTDIAGSRLQGYALNAQGAIDTSKLSDLRLATEELAPRATDTAKLMVNLNSNVGIKPLASFNQNDPTTYNNATSMTTYDSLGEPHIATYYFLKTAINQYDVVGAVDGNSIGNVGTLRFNNDGTMDPATSTLPITMSYGTTNGSVSPATFTLNPAGTTQFGSDFSVNELTQNGNAPARLDEFSISSKGEIFGRYNNGDTRILGQVALATFRSEQGLLSASDTKWIETNASGQPTIGTPGVSGAGLLVSGTVEDSNVDMTQELVAMMGMQRLYQANSQTIKTMDSVSQTLMNIR